MGNLVGYFWPYVVDTNQEVENKQEQNVNEMKVDAQREEEKKGATNSGQDKNKGKLYYTDDTPFRTIESLEFDYLVNHVLSHVHGISERDAKYYIASLTHDGNFKIVNGMKEQSSFYGCGTAKQFVKAIQSLQTQRDFEIVSKEKIDLLMKLNGIKLDKFGFIIEINEEIIDSTHTFCHSKYKFGYYDQIDFNENGRHAIGSENYVIWKLRRSTYFQPEILDPSEIEYCDDNGEVMDDGELISVWTAKVLANKGKTDFTDDGTMTHVASKEIFTKTIQKHPHFGKIDSGKLYKAALAGVKLRIIYTDNRDKKGLHKPFYGTGIAIGPHTVITAWHNVFEGRQYEPKTGYFTNIMNSNKVDDTKDNHLRFFGVQVHGGGVYFGKNRVQDVSAEGLAMTKIFEKDKDFELITPQALILKEGLDLEDVGARKVGSQHAVDVAILVFKNVEFEHFVEVPDEKDASEMISDIAGPPPKFEAKKNKDDEKNENGGNVLAIQIGPGAQKRVEKENEEYFSKIQADLKNVDIGKSGTLICLPQEVPEDKEVNLIDGTCSIKHFPRLLGLLRSSNPFVVFIPKLTRTQDETYFEFQQKVAHHGITVGGFSGAGVVSNRDPSKLLFIHVAGVTSKKQNYCVPTDHPTVQQMLKDAATRKPLKKNIVAKDAA